MKKGFTLVELLAILCIIGLIAIIEFPIIKNISNEQKYEYIDYGNNKGTAIYCEVDSIMYCVLEDGTEIEVKQFKLKNN